MKRINVDWKTLERRMGAGEKLRWVPQKIHQRNNPARMLMLGNDWLDFEAEWGVCVVWKDMLIGSEERSTGVGFYELRRPVAPAKDVT